MTEIVWIGLLSVFLLGFVIQRGFYCFYLALSNYFLTKDTRLIKATIWAFLIAMIDFHTLHSLGIEFLNPKTFYLAGSIIGAIVFAIGMWLSGSCIVGTSLRAWMGQIGYWFTILGMGIGGWLTIWGLLKPLREALQKPSEVLINGKVATLDRLLGINHWVLVIIFPILLIWWLRKIESKKTKESSETELSLFKRVFKKSWGFIVRNFARACRNYCFYQRKITSRIRRIY
jgi:hypothetical protein